MNLPVNHYEDFIKKAKDLNVHPAIKFQKVFPDEEEIRDKVQKEKEFVEY